MLSICLDADLATVNLATLHLPHGLLGVPSLQEADEGEAPRLHGAVNPRNVHVAWTGSGGAPSGASPTYLSEAAEGVPEVVLGGARRQVVHLERVHAVDIRGRGHGG